MHPSVLVRDENGHWTKDKKYIMNLIALAATGWVVTLIGSYLIGRNNGRRSERSARAIASGNRTTKARDDYRNTIADLRAKLRISPDYGDEFFEASQPILAAAIERIRPFLSSPEWLRLNQTWDEYQSQDQELLTRQSPSPIQLFTEMKMPDQILTEFLERFEKSVTND